MIASVLVLCSLGCSVVAPVRWATTAHRHGGYVDHSTQTYRTTGYALGQPPVRVLHRGRRWDVARSLFGADMRGKARERLPLR